MVTETKTTTVITTHRTCIALSAEDVEHILREYFKDKTEGCLDINVDFDCGGCDSYFRSVTICGTTTTYK